jgi:hypothetical protein
MSTLLEQASLVLIPSGYKEDVVYSQIPTSGAGDLSFTRASNGTRVNSAGLVEVCPWNLLSNTNTFSSWDLEGGALTSGFTAPDSTSTAYKYVQVPGGSLYSGSASPTSGVKTASVWLKSVSGTSITCILGDGDASNTTVVSVTGDWQLFTATYTTSTSRPSLYIYGISNASGIYVWHPQLNIGSTAKPYFPTTDRLNVPRLTYQNGGGGCPSLLLEKQSTNLVLYSEQFDNAAWVKPFSTITANDIISPDGTQNADRLNALNSSIVYQLVTSATGIYTQTIYAKKGTNRYFGMSITGPVTNRYVVYFDLQAGTVYQVYNTGIPLTNTSNSITDVGNGWYRCQVTANCIGDIYAVYQCTNTTPFTLNSVGDLTNGSDGTVYLWGAQLEAGSYATSYIPTTSSSATRVADACFKTGISSLIGQTSGTVFVDAYIDNIEARASNILFYLQGSGVDKYVLITSSGGVRYIDFPNGNITNNGYGLTNGRHKFAIAYANNDFAFYIDGNLIGTDTSGTPSACSEFGFFYYASGYDFPLKVNEAVLFKTRLTNAELASLTTI